MARINARAIIPAPEGTRFGPAVAEGWPKRLRLSPIGFLITRATVGADGASIELELEIPAASLAPYVSLLSIASDNPDR
jgi:hypothetical protein